MRLIFSVEWLQKNILAYPPNNTATLQHLEGKGKMDTNKAALRKVLEVLPINSLVVIAAELERNRGGDTTEDVQEAIENLLLDVLNAASGRLEDSQGFFMQAVNWWYASYDSREWYQKILGANNTPITPFTDEDNWIPF